MPDRPPQRITAQSGLRRSRQRCLVLDRPCPYLATDDIASPAATKESFMIITATAAQARSAVECAFSWNLVDTSYHRDTDVILLGVGYRY